MFRRIGDFFTSPLRSGYMPPMTHPGDWVASLGVALYLVSIFALPWITVYLEIPMIDLTAREANSGLFVSPWAWVMVFVLVVIICGLWFVQTRGAVVLGAGIFCLIFNVIFYVGARNKINAIIGDIVALVRRLPILGPFLGELVREITKNVLSVGLAPGYYLLIPAGVLFIVGGSLRLSHRVGWNRGVRQ